MSGFEWAVIGLILFGMVVPFWAITIVTGILASKQKKAIKSPDRLMRYLELLDYMHAAFKKSNAEGQNGASIVAAIRELRNFPEHRDLSILYLEEVTITGESKFDDLARTEINDVEAFLLACKDG